MSDLHKALSLGDWEVVVVDAGSWDTTKEISEEICKVYGWKFVAVTLDKSSVGRTVAAAIPYVLGQNVLVLPCDCTISVQALQSWRRAIAGGATCGGFAKKYSPAHWAMNAYAQIQNVFRSRWCRHLVWTNGIFFSPTTKIPKTGFLEDVLLSDTLRQEKGWSWISNPISVSTRRYYPQRIMTRIVLNFFVLAFFRMGFRDFTKLKRLYLWVE